jgi:hypothetical protein
MPPHYENFKPHRDIEKRDTDFELYIGLVLSDISPMLVFSHPVYLKKCKWSFWRHQHLALVMLLVTAALKTDNGESMFLCGSKTKTFKIKYSH